MAHMYPSERSHANRKWGNCCCIEETNHIAMQRRWDKCKLLLESRSLSWAQRSARPACSTYLRELLLYEPTACALVGVYKLCPFCFWVGRKQNMHIVLIVVPLLQGDVVRRLDILKNFFQLFRDSIVNDLAPILHNENQMVVKGEHRMIITFQNHCKPSPFPFNTGYTTKEENVQGGPIPGLSH